MKGVLSGLSYDQLRLLQALLKAKSDADARLAEVTNRMRRAAMRSDVAAFEIAKAEAARAHEDCDACALAFRQAIQAFTNSVDDVGERTPDDLIAVGQTVTSEVATFLPDQSPNSEASLDSGDV